MPENVLLHLPPDDREAVLAAPTGQRRVEELFRRAVGRPITMATLSTLAGPYAGRRARQARTRLAPEGITIHSISGPSTRHDMFQSSRSPHATSTDDRA
ncbi:NaeI family type II restriction endonuclease [Streptomyces anulatus]